MKSPPELLGGRREPDALESPYARSRDCCSLSRALSMDISLSRWVEMKEDFWSEDIEPMFDRKLSGMDAACAEAGTPRDVPEEAAPAPAERAAPAAEESMFISPAGPLPVTVGGPEVRAAGMANRERRSVA